MKRTTLAVAITLAITPALAVHANPTLSPTVQAAKDRFEQMTRKGNGATAPPPISRVSVSALISAKGIASVALQPAGGPAQPPMPSYAAVEVPGPQPGSLTYGLLVNNERTVLALNLSANNSSEMTYDGIDGQVTALPPHFYGMALTNGGEIPGATFTNEAGPSAAVYSTLTHQVSKLINPRVYSGFSAVLAANSHGYMLGEAGSSLVTFRNGTPVPYSDYGLVYAVMADDSPIGGTSFGGPLQATKWIAGQPSSLGALVPYGSSIATAGDDVTGKIVGVSDVKSPLVGGGFVWSPATQKMSQLPFLRGFSAGNIPYGIANDRIVGECYTSDDSKGALSHRGYLFEKGKIYPLDTLIGGQAGLYYIIGANSINAGGDICAIAYGTKTGLPVTLLLKRNSE